MLIRGLLLVVIGILIFAPHSYGQNTPELIGEVAKIYTGSETSASDLIGGFTAAGLMGGVLLGSAGFVAFMYGKKNAEFKPMIIGILLMGLPYFVRNTMALYLVGAVLIASLFLFRE